MTDRVFPSRWLRRLAKVIDRRELRIWTERCEVSENAWSIDVGIQSAPYGGEKIGVGETKVIRVCCRKPFAVKQIIVPSNCAVSFEVLGLSVADQSFVEPNNPVPCANLSELSSVEFSQAFPDLDSLTVMFLTVRNIGYEPRRFIACLRGETLRRVRRRKGKRHSWQLKEIKAKAHKLAMRAKRRRAAKGGVESAGVYLSTMEKILRGM